MYRECAEQTNSLFVRLANANKFQYKYSIVLFYFGACTIHHLSQHLNFSHTPDNRQLLIRVTQIDFDLVSCEFHHLIIRINFLFSAFVIRRSLLISHSFDSNGLNETFLSIEIFSLLRMTLFCIDIFCIKKWLHALLRSS